MMTDKILEAFAAISAVPRPSKHEERICRFLLDWAAAHDFEADQDATGNIIARVPASAGFEAGPTIVIQSHVDMVCEKSPDSNHDFMADPIQLVREGDWLTADRTTLGADNGIAVAMAMVAATDPDLAHPPLELLFTVDEETGLTGANTLAPGFVSGDILLNIDTEDEGVFTIGCAGGRDTAISLPVERTESPAGASVWDLEISGLRGGHSGVDINLGRASAVGLMGRALAALANACEVGIEGIKGGSARNAIARDASARLYIPKSRVDEAHAAIASIEADLKAEFAPADPDLSITLRESTEPAPGPGLAAESARRLIDLLIALPHGVIGMSSEFEGLVETSTNLANIASAEHSIEIMTSQRGCVETRLTWITRRVAAIGRLAGADVESSAGYPSWRPNPDSPLLERCKRVYERHTGAQPVVEVIHAGLECGIIGSKFPGMDMISFGPTIQHPHSPDERVNVPSIGRTWDFLAALLGSFAE